MGLQRVRHSSLSALSALVAILLAPVPATAGGCSLIATDSGGSPVGLEIGDVVSIEGFNFAPGDVELGFSVDGLAVRTEIVTAADAFGNTGYFIVSVTPQAGEEGLWSVVGTEVEGTCSASTGFPVDPAQAPAGTPGPLVPDVATAPPRSSPSPTGLLGSALLLTSGLIVLSRAPTRSSRVT